MKPKGAIGESQVELIKNPNMSQLHQEMGARPLGFPVRRGQRLELGGFCLPASSHLEGKGRGQSE
ncbi:hypothetical protein CDL15_Pgr015282 [Punica granatum]|uniref:Uncharacterized protein n=1 Tax=Punica granatum TaxID=22663 RepID=A0A218VZ30_PUNGR|nr:hypothetical protein CDL15_Pgr015282 [Punica granatum]